MKKIFAIGLLCIVLSVQAADKDRYFEIAKNMEIFTQLYRELNTYYVDDIDPNKLMTDGITKMLAGLDPFTNYITGADLDEYQLQTTGKYGGVGARIGKLNDYVIITDLYEGFPAQKAGLQVGDAILEIDGKTATKYNSDEVSLLLKGEPGTKITVRVKRAISNQELTFVFNREEIKIQSVPYSGMLNEQVGYIKLTSFTENSSQEVQDALRELKKNTGLKGVVLDLRGNGGGLLNEAISICNTFVDKGVNIVNTKGKIADANFQYTTTGKPVDTEIPLVVLTDEGSASASEIVSGSMQDLDRGVIIGQNTYGKGLVQVTKPVAYKSKLKVTISKYYIPSGRCIQRIDYSHRGEDGVASALPDSLRKEFKTKAGRVVKDGAGIEPDIKTEPEKAAPITFALYNNNHVFDFANKYKFEHATLRDGDKFTMTDEEYTQFADFLKGKEYEYTTNTEYKLKELKKSMEADSYSPEVQQLITTLEDQVKHDKSKDLQKFKPEIKRLLEQEIVSRYTYEKGRIANSLKEDIDIKKALEVLMDNARYTSILSAKK
ncbi:MAG: S41 family peptidase [Chitinophagales bacterium]|jgi:carboxyl-terminal processing protease|nr:S41 family peptidase [Chitinophagales bacterium]HQO90337.1 S41 family peptidase [Chitinophagales bacterium]